MMRTILYCAVAAALALGACSPAPEGNDSGTSEATAQEAPKLEGAALAEALADEGIFLLDVRNPSELEELGTVEGYVNIPIDELADRLDELPKDQPILTA